MKQTGNCTENISLNKIETQAGVDMHYQKVKIGCVIMASGLSKRFGGSNKLLAEFRGKSFIQNAIDLTEGLFDRRVVVTRTPEVQEICRKQGIDVILHHMPGRNDAVALGVQDMDGMDGCLFCPCDQPLLTRESIEKMMRTFCEEQFSLDSHSIFRLAYGETAGSPVLFSKIHFDELAQLPDKKGGAYLVKKYPEQVMSVQAQTADELRDIDTQEDYEKIRCLPTTNMAMPRMMKKEV